jgi:hypothetical protein
MKSDIGSGGVAKDVLRALTAKCNDMKWRNMRQDFVSHDCTSDRHLVWST